MPVRFTCSVCNQLLSIGRRKVGSEVTCPKCTSRILVPSEEDAVVHAPAEEAVMHTSDAAGIEPGYGFAPFMYDDVPKVIVVPTRSSSAPARTLAPSGTVNISHGVLYAQAALIAAVAVLGFAFGYLSGRISGPVPPPAATEQPGK